MNATNKPNDMMHTTEALGSMKPTFGSKESCFLAIPIRIGPSINKVSNKERLRLLSKESNVRPMDIIAKQIILNEMSKARRPLRETSSNFVLPTNVMRREWPNM